MAITTIKLGNFVYGDFNSDTGNLYIYPTEGFTEWDWASTVSEYGEYIYEGLNITNITIDEKITTIAHYAFIGISPINNFEIPSTITKIYSESFNDTSFETITIPYETTEIETKAFYDNKNLQTIYVKRMESDIPSTWEDGWNYDNIPVVFPKSTISILNYKNPEDFKPARVYRYNGETWDILDINYLSKTGYIRIGG